MNPGAIMPKTHLLADINQFSGDFPGAGASHNSPPWHLPVERLVRWPSEPQAIAAALSVNKTITQLDLSQHNITEVGAQAPRSSGSPEKNPVGKEMARSPVGWRGDVFLGWGLGETFWVSGRLWWSIFDGAWGGIWVNCQCKTSFAFLPFFAEESLWVFPKPPVWQSEGWMWMSSAKVAIL